MTTESILKRVINIKQSVTNKVKNVVKTQNQTVESLKKTTFYNVVTPLQQAAVKVM